MVKKYNEFTNYLQVEEYTFEERIKIIIRKDCLSKSVQLLWMWEQNDDGHV